MLISVKQLILDSWRLFLTHWKALFVYALASSIMGGIIGLLAVLAFGSIGFFGVLSGNGPAMWIMAVAVGIVVILAAMYLGSWLNAATLKAALTAVTGGTVPRLGEKLKETKPMIWRVLGATIAVSIMVLWPLLVAGLMGVLWMNFSVTNAVANPSTNIMLVILFAFLGTLAGVYFAIKLIFTMFGVVFEGRGIKESMHMSKSLVSGRWFPIFWRIFASIFVFWLMLTFLGSAVKAIAYLVGDNSFMNAAAFIAQLAFQIIFTPLFFFPGILLYQSAKQTSSTTSSGATTPPAPMATA